MCKLLVDPEGEGIVMEGREANPAWFHGVCRNAERYLWKQADDMDKLRGRDDKSCTATDTLKRLKENPTEYQHKVLSLVVTGQVRRGKEDKVKAIKVLEDLIYETSVAEQEEVMFLRKFAFIKAHEGAGRRATPQTIPEKSGMPAVLIPTSGNTRTAGAAIACQWTHRSRSSHGVQP